MRLDRWFKHHLPQVTFAYLNKLTRTGQVRVAGARVKTSTRLARRAGDPCAAAFFRHRQARPSQGRGPTAER